MYGTFVQLSSSEQARVASELESHSRVESAVQELKAAAACTPGKNECAPGTCVGGKCDMYGTFVQLSSSEQARVASELDE